MKVRVQACILATVFLATAVENVWCASDKVTEFEIKGRPVAGMPIAIPPFIPANGSSVLRARTVSSIINADLGFLNDFSVLKDVDYPGAFARIPSDPLKISFADWSRVGARYLVHGQYLDDGDTVHVRWRLFETRCRRQILGYEYKGKREFLRKIAHRIADEIVWRLTGNPGIAQTRMAFVCSTGGNKELWVSDWDGANPTRLTHDNSLVVCPEWSPGGGSIAYTSYGDSNPDLYTIEVETGKRRSISRFQGINIAPAWSPNHKHIAFTLSKDGNNEIYLKDIESGVLKRLTRHRALDTSPTFSPDGRQIAFVSTRGGSPQIWVMAVDGTDLRRLSYQGGNSYDPAWSPKGDKIAYVVEGRGHGFEIYVMDINGRNATRLTDSAGTNEAPSWSPDGEHVAFCSSRTGRNEIFVMKDDGTDARLVTRLDGPCASPVWSPSPVAGR